MKCHAIFFNWTNTRPLQRKGFQRCIDGKTEEKREIQKETNLLVTA